MKTRKLTPLAAAMAGLAFSAASANAAAIVVSSYTYGTN
ncbi:MAG: hypothetical protein ACI9MB_003807, partial [Verrucomicrobiales bacterium]